MLKATSALASAKPYVSSQLTIVEQPDFTLTQYAGQEKDLQKALGRLPVTGKVMDGLLRISPSQILLINRHSRESGNPPEALRDSRFRENDVQSVFTTALSSSRSCIKISGAPARDVLAKSAAIDFHKSEFKPGTFAQTGIHHVPVLIHCVEADTFHIYVMRTFALSIWDYLTDAALEYA
jgi:heterotetrameric sarcosine oxidase gamma subunit